MKPTAHISKIFLKSGQELQVQKGDKVLIVGANNCGKSLSLREVASCTRSFAPLAQNILVSGLELSKCGTKDNLDQFLESNSSNRINGNYLYKQAQISPDQTGFWNRPNLAGSINGMFVKYVGAETRLQTAKTKDSIAPSQPGSAPQHVMFQDAALFKKVSDLFKKAFGQDLMFDFRGGSKLPIHVGDLPDPLLVNQVSDEYVEAVRENPNLDQQGDGMKSYAGLLFDTLVDNSDITLIDEPEAFLHPPQRRRLGETLSSEMKGQLFVATHSSDILRGFLSGTSGGLRIVRLQRNGNSTQACEALPDQVRELWEHPELRYSNALDGIFHEQTIICEDDSDCRLYQAVSDHLVEKDGTLRKDTAFVPTGGKHGVKKVAGALRHMGVPVKAVFDIDFLAEENVVADTVAAFGGDWEQGKVLWDRVNSAVRDGTTTKSNEEIKTDIKALVDAADPNALPRRAEILDAYRQNTPWNVVKKMGKVAIPAGQAQTQFDDLKKFLSDLGIYVVEKGEVENFCREIGGHGPKFVSTLLSNVPLGDARLADLRSFVKTFFTGAHAPLSEIQNAAE